MVIKIKIEYSSNSIYSIFPTNLGQNFLYIVPDMKRYYNGIGRPFDERRKIYPFKKFRNRMKKYYEN